jgi:hypothetical protein
MEMEEVIEIWKREGIDHAEFGFSCGNDSMDDTDLTFFDKENKPIKETWGLYDYFDDAIYDNVQFYEASDGYYIGEQGTVTIQLNEEGDDFDYDKSSTAEYDKREDDTIHFELTKEQAQFLEEYVSDMSGGEWDGDIINYKKDFILTEEHEEMIVELHSEFMSFTEKWTYGLDYEPRDESALYEMKKVVEKEDGKFYAELEVSCGLYFYEDE